MGGADGNDDSFPNYYVVHVGARGFNIENSVSYQSVSADIGQKSTLHPLSRLAILGWNCFYVGYYKQNSTDNYQSTTQENTQYKQFWFT